MITFALSSPPLGMSSVWQKFQRIGPFGLIVLLHIGFFYALTSGLLQQAAQSLPHEVVAIFIQPEKPQPPAPPKPAPAPAPKTVQIIKKTFTPPPSPVVPVVNTTPSEQAITVAPTLPAPPAPPVIATPPTSTAPPTPTQMKTISSGVEYLQPPQPEYPAISKRMAEEGRVLLRVLVNTKGRPEHVEVSKSSGFARLDEAGRQAISRVVFKPYIDNGNAVAVYVIVPITFQLDN
jgi:periplasmic protein TonB